MMNHLRVKILQDFEVPGLGLYAEGTEYMLPEETARELAGRGIVELLETKETPKEGKKAKIVTT